MRILGVLCPRCQQTAPPGTQYCPRCGEILDPGLIAELQRLAVILRDLDQRIAAGKGEQTVADLREEYFTRYQDIRRVRPAGAAQATSAAAAAQPAPTLPTAGSPLAGQQAARTAGDYIPIPSTSEQADGRSVPAAASTAQPSAPTAQPGPVFSWRAFVSEQAISIMAYLGGFLALIATLTFVVSKSATLPTLTLVVVCLGYLAFGCAGLGARTFERLRMVSRVYLGVFALMTPLVALALYRFALQDLNFSVAGMLCVSALYAWLVYLALAVQTRFTTYAYLGWAALIVAAIALLPWTHSDLQWWVFVLGLVTLALLGPRQLRQVPLFHVLVEPAMQVAALTTIPTVLGVQVLGAVGLAQLVNPAAFPNLPVQAAPLAMGACMLVPVTAGWRLVVPGWRPRQQHTILDVIDGFNAVFFAEAVGGVALWIGAENQGMAYTLAALALIECGLAVFLYRWHPQRTGLRRFLEFLAVGLAVGGAGIVFFDSSPNWPLVAALSAGLVVTVGVALMESGWWLLVSGLFLTLDYVTLAQNLLSPGVVSQNRATLAFALALALWCAALALGLRTRTRRLVGPVYLVAFGEALYTTALLPGHPASYQVELLLTFTAASLSAARRERQPVFGNVATGLFGVLAVGPLLVHDANGLHASLLALGFALAALAVRWRWGRAWGPGLYVAMLWAVVLTVAAASLGRLRMPDWTATGLPFTAWFLLFFVLLTFGLARWEREPMLTIIPAWLAFWALALASGDLASVALVFALIGGGMAARRWLGRGWNIGVQVAAACGSVLVYFRLNHLGPTAPNWQVAFLLGMAVAATLVAVQEREPVVAWLALPYTLGAALVLPGPDNLVPTLALTFALAGVGALLRLPSVRGRIRRFGWAAVPYAAAIGCSGIALLRVTPFDATHLQIVLLVYAAVAYALAVLEGQPLGLVVPLLYVLAAVVVQPNAHALLPLAIGCAVLGLIAGRAAGPAWSWPFYVAASLAALFTAVLGLTDSAFEAGALFTLAALAYVIALAESRPDVLPGALLLGVLALSAEINVLHLSKALGTLAFLGLGWLFLLGTSLWRRIPWLRPRGGAWWVTPATLSDPAQRARWSDPRLAGALIHRVAGYLLAGGTALAAVFAPGAFSPHTSQALAAVFALLSLAGMLALLARTPRYSLSIYGAGLLSALAITWGVRWLGADNVQAFVVAPGSYLLLVGAFLPADQRVVGAPRTGQASSLAGALLLMLPTLYQSFTEPDLHFQLVYGLVLLVEAVVIVGLGVGARSRLLILTGSAFIGIDTLSGVGLALRSGLSPAVVLALLALLLVGLATWLSLRRTRHDSNRP